MIDRLMDNRWFMKIIALVLAALLFSSVPKEEKATDENIPAQNNAETLADVPVKSYYDTDNLVVSGVPDTVEVTIQGPNSIVQTTKALRNFEVYVDLSDAGIGNQRVPIRVRDISEKLEVTVEPGYANVSIQERVTKEFKVDAEFNKSLLDNGFISEQPVVEPNKVKITGAKDIIDRISFVKATMDLRGSINNTFTKEASIQAFDRELNKLDVIVDPETVEVTVPVKSLSKTVPINIVRKGTPPDGVTIESVAINVNEATIFADPEVLKETESVRVEVDVSNIQKNSEVTLPVIISEGISKVDPETVTASITVNVNTEDEKTLSGLPIKAEGINEQFEIAFEDPADAAVNLTVTGPGDTIRGLGNDDFNLFINVAGLSEGEYELDIQVTGPSNVEWKLAKETTKISITQKEEA